MKRKVQPDAAGPTRDGNPAEYDAPEVERVMDADDLAREIHYAGTANPSLEPG